MNRRTAKPSEQVMRFFTPELFIRFNSSDEDEADNANEEWEAALRKYRKHLDRIRERIPQDARELSDGIRQHPSSPDWRFSRLRTHWLYDEVDVDESQRGQFLHRVLLSDGRVLEIPFMSVMIRHAPLYPLSGGEMTRTSA